MGSDQYNAGQNFGALGNLSNESVVKALSQMLGREIAIDIPSVEVISFNEITVMLGQPDKVVVGTLLNLEGDLNGYILMVQEPIDAYRMSCLLTGAQDIPPEKFEDYAAMFDEYTTSALTEITNIVAGAYLNALSSMTGLKMRPSVPQLIIDMAAAILSVPAIAYGRFSDSVLQLKTRFDVSDTPISGHFVLIPDEQSYKSLMNALGAWR